MMRYINLAAIDLRRPAHRVSCFILFHIRKSAPWYLNSNESIGDMQPKVLAAIDISKERHDVLLELPREQRKKFRIGNHKADFDCFGACLSGQFASWERFAQMTILTFDLARYRL